MDTPLAAALGSLMLCSCDCKAPLAWRPVPQLGDEMELHRESAWCWQGAISDCDEALVLEPRSAYALSVRGAVKYELGDYKVRLIMYGNAACCSAWLSDAVQLRP